MSILKRPYAGLWGPNKTRITQHSPDALVYLNGDTSLPACAVCRRNVEIQPYVTGISVDAGIEPGSHSATINMQFPKKVGDDIFRDGSTVLRPALEVHIYMRGYFPVSGLPMNALDNPSDAFLDNIDFQAIPQYPYYQVFHGVVTNVSLEYSGGFYSASLSCNSMLHFWGFQNLSTNAAVFGARPSNSRLRTDLRGNYYTGMSPMGIIYTLYKDTIGSADGQDLVSFALGSTTNFNNKSLAEDESLFSLAIRYWERRFKQGPYKLRMHGASGQLLSTAQQAFLGRLGRTGSSGRREKLYRKFIKEANKSEGSTLASNPFRALFGAQFSGDPRLMRNQDLLFLLGASGTRKESFGVSHEFFEVVVKDLGQLGTVNLFEGTYETKLNMAEMAAKVSGFEFFQDVDGDLVFKPPLYNLDTRSSQAYNLNPEDIMSISFAEGEPEATYITCRNGPFRNMRGIIDENEWGIKGTYIDYRLVGQFGFRPTSIETNYYNSPKSAYYAAVARLDVVNSNINSCSATIPLRAELRPGYPVYIPHVDCYYYTTSISHSFQFGGQCTTSLTLTARRRKFHGPRAMGAENKSGPDRVDLQLTSRPKEILREVDSERNPRITGFPNVVMALDPENIDPFAFFLGDDQTNFGDAKNIDNLIVLLQRLKYLKVSSNNPDILELDNGESITKDSLYRQGAAYTSITQELDRIRKRRGKNTQELEEQLKLRVAKKFNREVGGRRLVEKNVDFSRLLELYDTARGDYLGIMGLDRDYLNSTSGLLDLLGNKKTSFASGVTGYYRYFSSAHPNEKMQGPSSTKDLQITSTLDNRSSVIAPVVFGPATESLPDYLSPEEKRVFIEKNDDLSSVKRGLPIDRAVVKGDPSFDKVVPTHEILTLSFQKSKTKVTKNVLRPKITGGRVNGLASPADILRTLLQGLFGTSIREASKDASQGSIAGRSVPQTRQNLYIVTVPNDEALGADNINNVVDDIRQLQRSASGRFFTNLFNRAKGKITSTDLSPITNFNAIYQNDVRSVARITGLRDPAKAGLVSVTVTQEESIQTPVFPVSDGEGYEVVGSYQYGRGLRIEPGGNYQTLMASDPIYYATPELRRALEAAIDDLYAQNGIGTQKSKFGRLTSRQKEELVETVRSESLNPANAEVLRILQIEPSRLGTGEVDDRIDVVRNGLRNFIEGQNASVFKLPVTNAAIALSEIKPVRVEESCTFCQSGTADVHLDAFATDQFLLVDTEDIQERASQALADTMLNKEPDWRLRQQALRGETQDQGRNSLWNSVTGTGGLIDSYEKTFGDGETFEQRLRTLQDQRKKIQDLLEEDDD